MLKIIKMKHNQLGNSFPFLPINLYILSLKPHTKIKENPQITPLLTTT